MPQTSEILNDIKIVLDITSRVDERVKLIQSSQQDLNVRMNQLIGEFNQLSSRVSVLESRNGGQLHAVIEDLVELRTRMERVDAVGSEAFRKFHDSSRNNIEELEDENFKIKSRLQTLESYNDSWQARVKHYGGLFIQGIWVIIVCYLLFKLGLTTSPLP